MESKAIARFARISPRKARVVVNLVRGQKVARALDVLAFTRKSGAPIVKKLIESAIDNARQADANVDVDALWITMGAVDKGPNKHLRRWRPRAMGRATQIQRGISHIQIVLSDQEPAKKLTRREKVRATRLAAKAPAATDATASTTTTTTTTTPTTTA